ncbi:hypothetical protein MMC13_003833 [Lambiella insularis]|nr:hypothetical protein [Lambiella insularis]
MNPPLDLQIFTSIRSDPALLANPQNDISSFACRSPSQFYMLPHHRDRLLAAADALQWIAAVHVFSNQSGLINLIEILQSHLQDAYSDRDYAVPLRIRVTCFSTGTLAVTSSPVPALSPKVFFPFDLSPNPEVSSESWRIFLFAASVKSCLYTTHKTTFRGPYNAARAHLSASDTNVEMLLHNTHGEITEGTLTTPYFWRGGKWITPNADCGGNLGTTRRWALDRKLCIEGVVRATDIKEGECVWLSNGVRGFGWGRVKLESNFDD